MNARKIDELLGTPARLAIVVTLARVDSLSFTELGQETGLADGNLHVQSRKLMAAGYVAGVKDRKGNRRVTCFSLTELGHQRLQSFARMLAEAGGLGLLDESGFVSRARPGQSRTKDDSQVW